MRSRQQRWQDAQIAKGRCCTCGNKRGKAGTRRRCRTCADKDNAKRGKA